MEVELLGSAIHLERRDLFPETCNKEREFYGLRRITGLINDIPSHAGAYKRHDNLAMIHAKVYRDMIRCFWVKVFIS